MGSIPDDLDSLFSVVQRKAVKKNRTPQRFSTCVLVRGSVTDEVSLTSEWPWVNEQLEALSGNLFVTDDLLERLISCEVGDEDQVFGQGLSDHLPIIADFRETAVRAND